MVLQAVGNASLWKAKHLTSVRFAACVAFLLGKPINCLPTQESSFRSNEKM